MWSPWPEPSTRLPRDPNHLSVHGTQIIVATCPSIIRGLNHSTLCHTEPALDCISIPPLPARISNPYTTKRVDVGFPSLSQSPTYVARKGVDFGNTTLGIILSLGYTRVLKLHERIKDFHWISLEKLSHTRAQRQAFGDWALSNEHTTYGGRKFYYGKGKVVS